MGGFKMCIIQMGPRGRWSLALDRLKVGEKQQDEMEGGKNERAHTSTVWSFNSLPKQQQVQQVQLSLSRQV
jgi:hypothetical protein